MEGECDPGAIAAGPSHLAWRRIRRGVVTVTVKRLAVSAVPAVPTQNVASGLKFDAGDGFYAELRRRVDQYFETVGHGRRDRPQMYLKTALVGAWCVASYVLLLVFAADSWWLAVPFALSLALSLATVGFNVQHDAGHSAYSGRRWVNRLMASTLDLMGGSSYVWTRKHNSIHHSYANITGYDDDLDIGVLGRLTPHQPRLPFHRLQHYYLWLVYGFLPLKWLLWDDFRHVITGRIGGHRLARPKGWDLVTFILGKLGALLLMFGIPLMLHPLKVVLIFYAVVSFVLGVIVSVVFQLAHCVEEAAFPEPPSPGETRVGTGWAAHQARATVNFARGNRLLSWMIGGLNFQIEHHLFPQISHVHYPAIAPLVEQTCKDYGLQYTAHETLLASVVSHFRWLRRMGMPGTTA
jgi:linoleoyl-CoA desaturase